MFAIQQSFHFIDVGCPDGLLISDTALICRCEIWRLIFQADEFSSHCAITLREIIVTLAGEPGCQRARNSSRGSQAIWADLTENDQECRQNIHPTTSQL